MENKAKKFRNPFPAVGKVFKYEMISVARRILPVYAVLLALSLVIGIFVMDNNLDFVSDGELGVIKALIVMLTIILFSVMIVILFSVISRRFKKSILGAEAYLNLTLPVTIGEHLCGRYLANFVCAISYALVMVISVLLIFIRGWGQAPKFISELAAKSAQFKLVHGFGYPYMFFHSFIHCILFFMLVCVFIYVTQTVIHLVGKHKTLVAVLSFAIIFTLYHNIAQMMFTSMFDDMNDKLMAFGGFLLKMDIYDIVWIILLSIGTRLVLTFKLSLE